MIVFIDTNILLDFYSFTSDDLEEIKKFIALVESKAVTIVVTDQVWNEFNRNREAKIISALKRFKETNLSLSVPYYCKGFKEFEELQKLLGDARKKYSELVQKAEVEARNYNTEADHVMNHLFYCCGVEKISNDQYLRAIERHRRGNPPG